MVTKTSTEIYTCDPKQHTSVQVSEKKWRLTIVNGPQYSLCPSYPQLMYVPASVKVRGLPA